MRFFKQQPPPPAPASRRPSSTSQRGQHNANEESTPLAPSVPSTTHPPPARTKKEQAPSSSSLSPPGWDADNPWKVHTSWGSKRQQQQPRPLSDTSDVEMSDQWSRNSSWVAPDSVGSRTGAPDNKQLSKQQQVSSIVAAAVSAAEAKERDQWLINSKEWGSTLRLSGEVDDDDDDQWNTVIAGPMGSLGDDDDDDRTAGNHSHHPLGAEAPPSDWNVLRAAAELGSQERPIPVLLHQPPKKTAPSVVQTSTTMMQPFLRDTASTASTPTRRNHGLATDLDNNDIGSGHDDHRRDEHVRHYRRHEAADHAAVGGSSSSFRVLGRQPPPGVTTTTTPATDLTLRERDVLERAAQKKSLASTPTRRASPRFVGVKKALTHEILVNASCEDDSSSRMSSTNNISSNNSKPLKGLMRFFGGSRGKKGAKALHGAEPEMQPSSPSRRDNNRNRVSVSAVISNFEQQQRVKVGTKNPSSIPVVDKLQANRVRIKKGSEEGLDELVARPKPGSSSANDDHHFPPPVQDIRGLQDPPDGKYKTAIVPVTSNESTVSAVTDPTYFQNEGKNNNHHVVIRTKKLPKLAMDHMSSPAAASGNDLDASFDVNSPIFTSGDPFHHHYDRVDNQVATSVKSDEFSDPFFPREVGGTNIADTPKNPPEEDVQEEKKEDHMSEDEAEEHPPVVVTAMPPVRRSAARNRLQRERIDASRAATAEPDDEKVPKTHPTPPSSVPAKKFDPKEEPLRQKSPPSRSHSPRSSSPRTESNLRHKSPPSRSHSPRSSSPRTESNLRQKSPPSRSHSPRSHSPRTESTFQRASSPYDSKRAGRRRNLSRSPSPMVHHRNSPTLRPDSAKIARSQSMSPARSAARGRTMSLDESQAVKQTIEPNRNKLPAPQPVSATISSRSEREHVSSPAPIVRSPSPDDSLSTPSTTGSMSERIRRREKRHGVRSEESKSADPNEQVAPKSSAYRRTVVDDSVGNVRAASPDRKSMSKQHDDTSMKPASQPIVGKYPQKRHRDGEKSPSPTAAGKSSPKMPDGGHQSPRVGKYSPQQPRSAGKYSKVANKRPTPIVRDGRQSPVVEKSAQKGSERVVDNGQESPTVGTDFKSIPKQMVGKYSSKLSKHVNDRNKPPIARKFSKGRSKHVVSNGEQTPVAGKNSREVPTNDTDDERQKWRRSGGTRKIEVMRSGSEDGVQQYVKQDGVQQYAKPDGAGGTPQSRKSGRGTRRVEIMRSSSDDSAAREESKPTGDDSTTSTHERSNDESLSSIGSDIRRLRSILRRSRLKADNDKAQYVSPLHSTFTVYDEKSSDPMQRAGLRLLSAAVIPMQCLVRRHLGLREALTRMWALVIIQAWTRGALVRSRHRRDSLAATKIQAAARGSIVRDRLLLEHCCAIEIQRHVRGLLATLRVYEKLYKVTVIQSAYRKHAAMNEAMDRMVSIIQIQSVGRAFIVHKKYKRLSLSVVAVQARFRAFFARLNYQLGLLDIIIVQSVWRKRSAVIRVATLRNEKMGKSATLVQATFRGFVASLNYRLDLLDIILVQSIWRRRTVAVRVRAIRNKAATRIQTNYRAFKARINLRLDLTNIIFAQNLWRKRSASIRVETMRNDKSAILIQSYSRRHVARSKYRLHLLDIVLVQSLWRKRSVDIQVRKMRKIRMDKGATLIQTNARCFIARLNYSLALLDIVMVQSIWRKRSATTRMKKIRSDRMKKASTLIQTSVRGFIARLDYSLALLDIIMVQSIWRKRSAATRMRKMRSDRMEKSSTLIQTSVRGFIARLNYNLALLDIIMVQSIWRKRSAATRMRKMRSDRMEKSSTLIQTSVRGFIARLNYSLALLDIIMVQSIWRKRSAATRTRKMRSERMKKASTLIQKNVRGFVTRLNYRLDLLDIIMVQSIWRKRSAATRVRELRNERMKKASILIQTSFRFFIARMNYRLELLDIVAVQSLWRKRSSALRVEKMRNDRMDNSATLIETCFRGFIARLNYRLDLLDIVIVQSIWRKRSAAIRADILRNDRMNMTATIIQTCFRAFIARLYFRLDLLGIIILQGLWRKRSATKHVRTIRMSRAATLIQTYSRGHIVKTNYRANLMDIILVQSLWRKRTSAIRVESMRNDHRDKAATVIQTKWRSYDCTMNFWHYLANVLVSQSAVRRWMARRTVRVRRLSTIKIQSVARICLAKRLVRGRLLFVKEWHAAITIQKIWRGFVCYEDYTAECAAITIQKTWRGFVCYADYMFTFADIVIVESLARAFVARRNYAKLRVASITVQRCWRGFAASSMLSTILVKRHKAAKLIQASWRRFFCYSKYVIAVDSAIAIQTAFRGYKDRDVVANGVYATTQIQKAFCWFLTRREERIEVGVDTVAVSGSALGSSETENARRIQAAARGHFARAEHKKHLRAREIQTLWRGFMIRESYLSLIAERNERFNKANAAITIQRYWRGAAAASSFSTFRENYSATLIQAAWRRFWCYTGFLLALDSAISIQTLFRGYKGRDVVANGIYASIQIQRAFCSFLTKREERIETGVEAILAAGPHRGNDETNNALRIQSATRGRFARSAFSLHLSARRIQTAWRGFLIRESYRAFKGVQRENHAATLIQSVWRRYWCHSYFMMLLNSASSIQTVYRGYKNRVASITATTQIQRAFSAFLTRREERIEAGVEAIVTAGRRRGIDETNDALRIQAATRGRFARSAFNSHLSARSIQTVWRGFVIRESYLSFMEEQRENRAATLIQSIWRRYWCHSHFVMLLNSVSSIQTVYRGYKNRVTSITATLQIQKAFSAFLTRREERIEAGVDAILAAGRCLGNDETNDALRIQAATRGHFARSAVNLHLSARNIQTAWRRFVIRESYLLFMEEQRENRAATLIQLVWRRYWCYSHFMMLLNSASSIQTVYRGYKNRVVSITATTQIQRAFSSFLARREERIKAGVDAVVAAGRRRANDETSEALRIQSATRGHFARSAFNLHLSARKIQTVWRGFLIRESYLSFMEVQRENRAVTLIQSAWRRFWCYSHFMMLLNSASSIQTVYRGYKNRVTSITATTQIQRAFSSFLARRGERIESIVDAAVAAGRRRANDETSEALRIQLATRGHFARSAINLHLSARKIQTVWRGFLIRESYLSFMEVQRENRAATLIQSAWRRFWCYSHFMMLLNSASSIQTVYRGYKYRVTSITAATQIQRAFSSFLARRGERIESIVDAAVAAGRRRANDETSEALRIQSATRGHFARSALNLHLSARKIQTVWRGFLIRESHLSFMEVQRENRAATLIQSAWRRFWCYSHFMMLLNSASSIQTVYRGYKNRVTSITATTQIQRAFSSFLARRGERIESIVDAAVAAGRRRANDETSEALRIQLATRGHFARSAINLHLSARKIQTVWRGFLIRESYLSFMEVQRENRAATLIQSAWRRFWCYSHFMMLLNSASSIQTVYRGYKYRVTSITAATQIQRAFSSFLARRGERIESIVDAAVAAGRRRANDETSEALRIQSATRGHFARSALNLHLSARKIQTVWRGFLIRESYLSFMEVQRENRAATLIQSAWRRFWCYSHFMMLLNSASSIQTVYRGYKNRVTSITATTQIQRAFSSFLARRGERIESIVDAAVAAGRRRANDETSEALRIQLATRGHFARSAFNLHLSARKIQTVWRGFLIRESYLSFMEVQRENRAATLIQSAWRRFWCYSHFMMLLNSASSIQTVYRGYKNRVTSITATTQIQRAFSSFLARREERIESIVDASVAAGRRRANDETSEALRIQLATRGHFARSAFNLHLSARKIQTVWRGFLIRESYLSFMEVQRENRAATLIQSAWRRFWCYSHFMMLLNSASSIQTVYRGYKNRVTSITATTQIRRAFSSFLARRDDRIESIIHAVIVASQGLGNDETNDALRIQAAARGHFARSALNLHSSARKIQTVWRGFLIRESYLEFIGARRFQTLFRGYIARAVYKDFISARRIQQLWRGHMVRAALIDFKSAQLIQSQWRGFVLRTALSNFFTVRSVCARIAFTEYVSARTIQSAWRRKSARNRFVRLRARVAAKTIRAVNLVQSVYRGFQVRSMEPSSLTSSYRAAMAIQKSFRGYQTRITYWNILGSTIQIQRFVRGCLTREHVERHIESTRKAATDIQKTFRSWIERERFVELVGAVIVVQTIFRGHLAKKEIKQRQFTSILRDVAASQTVSVARSTDTSTDLSTWELVIARHKEVEHAARKIQRFFLFVKAEVDRVVRLEERKRRRRFRKKQKHKHKDTLDEDLLENVWRNTVGPDESDEKIRLAEAAAEKEILKSKKKSKTKKPMEGVDLNQRRPRNDEDSEPEIPPEYQRRSPGAERLTGGLSSKPAEGKDASRQVPPSRLATLSRREMDDDFDLEEAWIDAEINHARVRRMKEKNSSSKHRSKKLKKSPSSSSRRGMVFEV